MTFDEAAVRVRREQMLLRLLFRATHTMNADMIGRIKARGWKALQPSFTNVLAHVDTQGTAISTLAARTGTSRQAVSQLVRAIEDAGFVERIAHPTDGRSVLVRHTDTGRRLLLDAIDVMSMIEAEYAERVGAAVVGDLKTRLAQLLQEVDPAGALVTE